MDRVAFSSVAIGFCVYCQYMKRTIVTAKPLAKRVPIAKYFGKHHTHGDQFRGKDLMDPPKVQFIYDLLVNNLMLFTHTLTQKINDHYNWLRDDTRKDDDVLNHLKKENSYCMEKMEYLAGLKNELYDDMLSHLKETDEDLPYQHGSFLYYSRTEKGLSYKIHCRKASEADTECVILDENKLATETGSEYLDISEFVPSPSHGLLAYSIDFTGYETYNLKVKDLATGHDLTDKISDTNGNIVWGADDSTVFYLTMDEEHRPHKLWRHSLGTPQEQDVCLHVEDDIRFWMGVKKSNSDAFILFGMESKETSEWYAVDIRPGKELRSACIRKREEGLRYDVEHHGEHFYIVTNQNAKNNRLVRVPVDSVFENIESTSPSWLEVRPYDSKEQIDEIVPFASYIAVFGRAEGIPCVWVMSPMRDISNWVKLRFSEMDYSVWCSDNYVFESDVLRLGYSSFVTPRQVLDVNMRTGEQIVKKEQEVPGFNRSLYICSRLAVTARDGRVVPLSLVYHKDVPVDDQGVPRGRPNPTLLYGYGSYGHSVDPSFDYKRLALLDRGVVYVIAHIRGGGEMGRGWYEDEGKYLTKLNTFNDFIDSAHWLVENGVTSSDRLAIVGRSAGGLLVGAVVNMAPALFKVAVADVPFVDVMNTMSDPSIPLTATEWEEWGNPNQEKFFEYMLSYSPYDNVRTQAYPSMLVTAGLHDPRVAYWEPAKWVAKLRELKTDENPLYFKTDLSTGHFSASDRYKYIKETAFEYSFILDQIGATRRWEKE